MNNDLQFLEDNFTCLMGNRNYPDRAIHLILKSPETSMRGFDRFRFKLGYKMYNNKVNMIWYQFELPLTKNQEEHDLKEEVSMYDSNNCSFLLLNLGDYKYHLTCASNFNTSYNGKYKLQYIKRFIQNNSDDNLLDGSPEFVQELLLNHFNNFYKQGFINSCPSYDDLTSINKALTYFNENLLSSSYYPHAETDVEGYYHEMKRVSFFDLVNH